MMWSRHSRRMDPISRSTYGFCHGDRGAEITSSIPQGFRHGYPVTTVDRIAVAQKISAPVVPGKSLPDLLHGPFVAGVFGHLKVQYAAPRMRQHHEHKQKSEGRRRYQEEIDGGHLFHVIGQEGSPSLGWWLSRAAKIFSHGRLCEVDS